MMRQGLLALLAVVCCLTRTEVSLVVTSFSWSTTSTCSTPRAKRPVPFVDNHHYHYASSFRTSTALPAEKKDDNADRKKEIVAQEAMNSDNLKASAAQLQSWSDNDLERIVAEVDNMTPEQVAQFQAMGMDPEMMKTAMKMMRDNPQMKQDIANMMNTMSPDELLEQSKTAQALMKERQQFQSTTADTAAAASASTSSSTADNTSTVGKETAVADEDNDDDDDEDEEDDDEAEEPVELDPAVLDAMFRVGEIMSDPPTTGGVTYAGFCSLPPIAVLSGDNGDDDLTTKELKDCWSKGSLGATRVDRKGFERVWAAVQDNYYNDICEEARERIVIKKKKKRGTTAKPTSPATVSTPFSSSATTPMVGASLTPEQLSNEIKNMKDDDLTRMFEQMSNMSPAEEARLKNMGVDPAMMKKSAAAMKNNPLLRKAATMMMKNTSPEQLAKASQEAQQKMSNMSDEEKKRLMDNLK